MSKYCFIIEDLLPLYNEGLLQEGTGEWLESHLAGCENCQELAQLSIEPVEKEPISSTVNHDKMMGSIKLKLSIYQIIFVGLSFFFAIKTSLLSESFGFILSYTIMGLVAFLFYRSFKIVIAIAFLPIFLLVGCGYNSINDIWTALRDTRSKCIVFLFLINTRRSFSCCYSFNLRIDWQCHWFTHLEVKERG